MTQAIKIINVAENLDLDAANADFHQADITVQFLLAGRAYFRVRNPKGEFYNFVIKSREGKPGSQWAGHMSYYLRVFREGNYRYIGVVNTESGEIIPTGRSEFLSGTKEYDVAAWALQTIFNKQPLRPGYLIGHTGKCASCGKELSRDRRGDMETGFHLDCVPSNE